MVLMEQSLDQVSQASGASKKDFNLLKTIKLPRDLKVYFPANFLLMAFQEIIKNSSSFLI